MDACGRGKIEWRKIGKDNAACWMDDGRRDGER